MCSFCRICHLIIFWKVARGHLPEEHSVRNDMEQCRELSRFFDACARGSADTVISLLDGGFDIGATDEDDTTALQIAAANGHELIVKSLLVRGAAVDQANLAGWTPLLHAARNGHAAVAALLIQNHADINVRTCYGVGVACLAARSGNLAICRLLSDAGAGFSLAADRDTSASRSMVEITPLVVAAHRGHDSVIKHLLSSTDPNYPAKPTGVTALMGAAVSGHVSAARLLVERGKVDVDAVDINRKSAFDYSIARDRAHVREYLKTKTTRSLNPALRHAPLPIIDAVKRGDLEQVRDILEVDVSQRDACVSQDGATPLMFSAMLGHFAIVKLLVEKGCSVNAQDVVSGWTALMQAVFHGQKEVAVYLIRSGADVTISAKSGCTAFDMASVVGYVDTELYRLIAARAALVTAAQQLEISSPNHTSSPDAVNHFPKSGVKAWWNRVSRRFHNLKQSESVSSEQHQLSQPVSDVTLRNPSSMANTDLLKSLTVNPLGGHYSDTVEPALKTNTGFSLDALGMASPGCSTLRSFASPVFPQPSFPASRATKLPPASLRKPLSSPAGHSKSSSLTLPAGSAVRGLPNQHSTLNLVNRVASPPPRVQFAKRPAVTVPPPSDISPSASYTAGTRGTGSGDTASSPASKTVLSSASSIALTAVSDKASPDVELLRNHAKNLRYRDVGKLNVGDLNEAKLQPNFAPKNLLSVGKDSGVVVSTVDAVPESELGEFLRMLSLDRYRPIFDEQEVDMEAFLTLTDGDLTELGIKSRESRRQILAVISEVNAHTARQRQLHGDSQKSNL